MDREETQRLADEGFAELEDGNYDRVLEIADELEARRYSASFELRGRALAALDRTDEAIAVLQDGVAKAPAATSIWHWLGTFLSDVGRYDEAIAAFDSETQHGGEASSAKLNKAIVEARRGDFKASLLLLDERPTFEPELFAWLTYRSDALRHLGQLEEALAASEEALLLASDDIDPGMASLAQRSRIESLAGLGQVDRAQTEALTLVRSNTADFEANELLCRLRGQPAEGLKCFNVLIKGETIDPAFEAAYTSYLVMEEDPGKALSRIAEVEGRVLKSASLIIEECKDVTSEPECASYKYAGVVWRYSGYIFCGEDERA
ncbi:MAG: bacterial transcriptional activator domain-containing protein [Planctomycetota bacterium]